MVPMPRPSASWTGADPLLELWIDVAGTPVTVHLSGVLDCNTGASLGLVVEQVLGEGHRSFRMDIDQLEVADAGGLATLIHIQRSVLSSGGEVTWSQVRPRSEAMAPPVACGQMV
jgi:anti-anti-sigma regulatory factor